jgi:polysaccharide pyruvyl transferase CsaB
VKENAIVLAGYYGFGNAGDELILRSLMDRLRLEDPSTQITVLSQNPVQTRQRFLVEAVNRWNPFAWIGPLWRARRFMLGGGGLLQETTGPWNHLYYLSLVLLAKILGCQTEVRAIGVDPIHHPLNRWWTRFVFNTFVDKASVRDTESAHAMQAVGVHLMLQTRPDLIFQLRSTFEKPSSPRLAMAVIPWRGRPGWEMDIAQMCDRVAEHLKVSVDLVPFFPI